MPGASGGIASASEVTALQNQLEAAIGQGVAASAPAEGIMPVRVGALPSTETATGSPDANAYKKGGVVSIQTVNTQDAGGNITPSVPGQGENTRLSREDLNDYLKTGKKKSVRDAKQAVVRSGENVILTSPWATREFIQDAISGEASGTTKAYGKVGVSLANDVYSASGGKLDIKDWYLELTPYDLKHAFSKHSKAKKAGNIPLSLENFLSIPDYIDTYDDVLNVKEYDSGDKTITLGKKINGYSVIVEMVSGNRHSIHFKNMWGLETETYEKQYKKGGIASPQTVQASSANDLTRGYRNVSATAESSQQVAGTEGALPTAITGLAREASAFDNSIPKQIQSVNTGVFGEASLHMTPMEALQWAQNNNIVQGNGGSGYGSKLAEQNGAEAGIAQGGTASGGAVALSDGNPGWRNYERETERHERVPEAVRHAGRTAENRVISQKRRAAVSEYEAVSPEELGVPSGSKAPTCQALPESDWDSEIRRGVEWAYSKGIKKVTPVVGEIRLEQDGRSGSVAGAINEATGEIFLRCDTVTTSFSENLEHEVGHQMATPNDAAEFERQARERFGEKAWAAIFDTYRQRYSAITNGFEGMEENEIAGYISEEIMADAYSGADKFGRKASLYGAVADQVLEGNALPLKLPTAAQQGNSRLTENTPEVRGPPEELTEKQRADEDALWNRERFAAEENERLDKAISMLDNGRTPSEVFRETGLVVMSNGDLRNGIGGEKIGEWKNGRAEGLKGELGNRLETMLPGNDGRRNRSEVAGTEEKVRLKSWGRLAERERKEILTAFEGRMESAGEEGKMLLESFGSHESMAETFYSKLQQGRAVAEEWVNFVPDIQNLMDEIEDIAGFEDEGITKVRFSLEDPVEETADLIALHNLTEDKLIKALKLGGLPMPSIAIVKADTGHSDYGPISLVFGKNTIDPEANIDNKVYGSDAWTPTVRASSFDSEATLEEIVKSMRESQKARGEGSYGLGAVDLQSLASKEYKSVPEIKDEKGRLGKVSEEVYSGKLDYVDDLISDVIHKIAQDNPDIEEYEIWDYATSPLKEAARAGGTAEAIESAFEDEGMSVEPDTVEMIENVFYEAGNLPTEYFEAKPERAVGFDEVLSAVIPDNSSENLKSKLQEAGVKALEYEADNEADRLEKVNSVENARFAVSDEDALWNQDRFAVDGENEYSGKPIGENDIKAVQAIGRKSINDFTSEELKATTVFAEKHWKEMGVKSPFFRAWFGDWRANDLTPIQMVQINPNLEYGSGRATNEDTGIVMSWGSQFPRETRNHNKSTRIPESTIANIGEIVEKGVLLDTETTGIGSKNKMPGTAFMHSFYVITEEDSEPSLYKLFAEEALNSKGEVFRRAYELKYIEKVDTPANSVLSQKEGLTEAEATTSIDTVADLFQLVKEKDSTFNPKPVSKVVDEDGNPLVVYHGTDKNFTVFDRTKTRSGMDIQGSFFSPWEIDAGGYGENVRPFYLNIKNPADESTAYKALDRFKGQSDAGIRAREYLESLGYDGVNNSGEEYIAFHPEQIKSATDNEGTFDKANPDIRFAVSDEDEDRQEMMQNLRRYVNGEMSTQDIRSYIDSKETDRESGFPQPINLRTYTETQAQKIVDKAHEQNMSVEEYLRENWELYDEGGSWDKEAREALKLEQKSWRFAAGEENEAGLAEQKGGACSMIPTPSSPSRTLAGSWLPAKTGPTTVPCVL